ncbi:MAG: hypothetical protein WCR52_07010 [Bacteroidota bacterium]
MFYLRLLLGPEILWLLFFQTVRHYAHSGVWDTATCDKWSIRMTYIVPFVLVPLSSLPIFLPFVVKPWFIARFFIASLVGGHYVLQKGLQAHSVQGPGIGTAYMLGIMLILMVVSLLTVVLPV